MSSKIGLVIFVIAVTSAYAINPLCNGACSECRNFYPLLRKAAKELKSDYLTTEKGLSNRYNSTIAPALKEREDLLFEYDKLLAELKAINAEIAIRTKQFHKEKENTQ